MGKIKVIIALVLMVIIATSAFIVIYPNRSSQQAKEGITIIDSQGYKTTLESTPNRIISIAPSVTPILFEIGVGDKIVGLTTYDDAPYNFSAWFAAGNMTSVGGFSTPSLEIILSLQPDVIFTTDINDAMIPNMRNLGLNVIVVGPKDINDIYQTIKLIGKATGAEKKADTLVNSLTSQINNVVATINAANIAAKPTVYFEIWLSNAGFMTVGVDSWQNDVITMAGGVNLFSTVSEEYPITSLEVIITDNPDVILLPTDMGGAPSYGSVDTVKARPGWSTISAVKNDQIYIIDGALFNQPGIRVAEQVQTIAACLYPNLFS
ncbi:MAG: cobalamin-binding protein [Nitrososphaerota archaeon]|nr:cobalamin-binding protein [Nitrososphaerota archaeon]